MDSRRLAEELAARIEDFIDRKLAYIDAIDDDDRQAAEDALDTEREALTQFLDEELVQHTNHP